jgi:cell wall-associated NlpC family hydrolase
MSTFAPHFTGNYFCTNNPFRMKDFFFIVVAIGMFSLAPVVVNAQATSRALKFIDNIEIVPGASSGENFTHTETKPSQKIITEVDNTQTISTIEKCSALQFKYALLLDTSVESITNLKLYSFIDGWMDTRYRYGGTDRSGIDCSAFADTLMSNVYNLNLPRTANEQYDICKKISKDDLSQGDLVFFNTRGGVSHVGVYLGNGYFVHSSIRGVMISSLNEDYYSKKYIGGGRASAY